MTGDSFAEDWPGRGAWGRKQFNQEWGEGPRGGGPRGHRHQGPPNWFFAKARRHGLGPEDLEKIEKRMAELAAKDEPVTRRVLGDRFVMHRQVIDEHGDAGVQFLEQSPHRGPLAALVALDPVDDAVRRQLRDSRLAAIVAQIGEHIAGELRDGERPDPQHPQE